MTKEEYLERQRKLTEQWWDYLNMCKKPVLQDSHCVLLLGHKGPCRDNLGQIRD